MSPWTGEDPACPFCKAVGRPVLSVHYSKTAEFNPAVTDVTGEILVCAACGIAYPSTTFDLRLFSTLYSKSLGDHSYFHASLLQQVRQRLLAHLVRRRSRNVLGAALQVPLTDRVPVRVLDVGCGFGEFSSLFRDIGAKVTATEVIPQLVDYANSKGIDCRLGSLETLDLQTGTFDLILFRAVLYRTHGAAESVEIAKRLLAPDGRISVIDPCVDEAGISYFAGKQFPQGRYYITNFNIFRQMLNDRHGLRTLDHWMIYGRPAAPLKEVRLIGNIVGIGELLLNNLLKRKPYMVAYLLARNAVH